MFLFSWPGDESHTSDLWSCYKKLDLFGLKECQDIIVLQKLCPSDSNTTEHWNFFNCFLAALWPALGHYVGDILIHPMLIITFLHFQSKGHGVLGYSQKHFMGENSIFSSRNQLVGYFCAASGRTIGLVIPVDLMITWDMHTIT